MKLPERTKLPLAVLVLSFLVFTVLVLIPDRGSTPFFRPHSQFAVGVNYPWRNYGGDFGATVWGVHEGVSTAQANKAIDQDFEQIAKVGFQVVRWFIFCDGRGGLKFSKEGGVIGLDEQVLADIDAAIALAEKHKLRIIFVLLDFNFAQPAVWYAGKRIGGHRKIIEKPTLTTSFQNNALEPILKAFGQSTTVAAWEIINEPEWVMTAFPYWQTSKIANERFVTFVRSTALFIKARATQPVTVGSATLSDLHYWSNCDLDFLQFHHYPATKAKKLVSTPVANLGYKIPVILGEFPTGNTRIDANVFIDQMHSNGYLGALAWSFRASDKYSNLAKQETAISAWIKLHPVGKP